MTLRLSHLHTRVHCTVFRQWCDALGCATVVIEQSNGTGGASSSTGSTASSTMGCASASDTVVVDLATLRLPEQELSQAVMECMRVASQHPAVTQLPATARPIEAVPFNILPHASFGPHAPAALPVTVAGSAGMLPSTEGSSPLPPHASHHPAAQSQHSLPEVQCSDSSSAGQMSAVTLRPDLDPNPAAGVLEILEQQVIVLLSPGSLRTPA